MSQKKIALVGYRLNKGGAEKVMATLSNFFHEKGIETHVVIILDDIEYEHSGIVVNLGKLKNGSNGVFNKLKRFVFLRKYLKAQNFDYIIDFRFRPKALQELLISKWLYPIKKTIYTVHSSKLEIYMPKFSPMARYIYGNCLRVISLTKSMENLIKSEHKLKNVTTVFNPIDISRIEELATEETSLNFEYIIGVGHFNTNQKQFDKLIQAYSKSILPKKNIALVILGDGLNKEDLINEAKLKDVFDMVHFLGFKNNPYRYISRAKYFVMSSLHEGLPMVLIESLACGTPIISYDCPTGPRDIVEHKENGLLVKNQNMDELIAGMNLLINDNELYQHCKSSTYDSAKKFSIDSVGEQWLKLMNIE